MEKQKKETLTWDMIYKYVDDEKSKRYIKKKNALIENFSKMDEYDYEIFYVMMKEVKTEFNITDQELKSKGKLNILVVPRQIIMFFSQRFMNIPLKFVGFTLGGRDHATIIHGVDKVEQTVWCDSIYRQRVTKIGYAIFGDEFAVMWEKYKHWLDNQEEKPVKINRCIHCGKII